MGCRGTKKKAKSTGERRSGPRYDSVNLLYYEDFDETGEGKRQGIASTENISTGGLLMRTVTPLAPDSKVSVEVFTKLQRKIRAICEVTHVKELPEGGCVNGLRFLAISRDDREYLAERFPPGSPECDKKSPKKRVTRRSRGS